MKPEKVLLRGLAGLTFLALAGCGFKGPLVVPEQATDNQSQQQQNTTKPQTSPQSKEK